jgi:hypothetical protein
MVDTKNILNVRLATDTIPPILSFISNLQLNRFKHTNKLGEHNLYFTESNN